MNIAGIQKLTLVDFPGTVATTLFTQGCNFRCGFCHNPELVLKEKFTEMLSEREVFDFLESRIGKIFGVCITGGEPLLQSDLDKFITKIKALGFLVKLDTNGSMPEKLAKIIEDGDVDYIAMDIKGPLSKYSLITKNPDIGGKIRTSIDLIMTSDLDYEFRTTVCHPYLDPVDFREEIGTLIEGAKRYFIQNFHQSKHISSEIFRPFSNKELILAKENISNFVKEATVR